VTKAKLPPGVRVRPDGRYEQRITLDGRRMSVYALTLKELKGNIERAVAEHAQAKHRAAHVTVGDYLNAWIAGRQSPPYAFNTLRKYRSTIAVHLIPRFGETLLLDLSPRDVERMTNELLMAGMGPKSVNAIRQTLSTALNDAVRDELVPRNVVALTKPPRMERHEVQPLTLEEAHRFLSAIRGDRLEALYTAVLAVGIRQAEALGLRWQDVDLRTGEVRLDVQLIRLPGRFALDRLKTPAARRRFYLPAPALDALRRHKERETAPHEWGLIFTTAKGAPIHGSSLRLWFHAHCERAGVPYQKFHDFRHCCVSLLIAQGVTPRHIADLVGHTSTHITMNVYGHIFDDARRDVAATMGRLLAPKEGAPG
jgi:integrase